MNLNQFFSIMRARRGVVRVEAGVPGRGALGDPAARRRRRGERAQVAQGQVEAAARHVAAGQNLAHGAAERRGDLGGGQ